MSVFLRYPHSFALLTVAPSKKELQAKVAKKIVEAGSKKNKKKADSSDETQENSEEDNSGAKSTSNLNSKSKKIHKQGIETRKNGSLRSTHRKADSEENTATSNGDNCYLCYEPKSNDISL